MNDATSRGEPNLTVERAQALVERAAADLSAAADELRAAQTVVDLLLQISGPLAIVEHGIVRGWSRALEEITGVSAAAAIGRPIDPKMSDSAGYADTSGASWFARVHRSGDFEAHVFVAAPR